MKKHLVFNTSPIQILILLGMIVLGTILVFSNLATNDLVWDYEATTERLMTFDWIRARTIPVSEDELQALVAIELDRLNLNNETVITVIDTSSGLNGTTTIVDINGTHLPLSTWFTIGPDQLGNKIRLGRVILREDYTWEIRSFNLSVDTQTIITALDNQQGFNHYTKILLQTDRPEYNELHLDARSSIARMSENYVEHVQSTKKGFHRWNPRIALGGTVGAYRGMSDTSVQVRTAPELSVSLMSYGVSKNDINFKFLGLGISPGETYIGGQITPISVRVHPKLPNTYWNIVQVGYGTDYSLQHSSVLISTGLGLNF